MEEEDREFTACRFDFRIDNKNGLTPSRRKRAEKRPVNYNTLFKCKVCGSLFESRPALLAHKLQHSEYKCDYCSDSFQKKSIWRLHVTKVHGIQPDPPTVKKPGSGSVMNSVKNLLVVDEERKEGQIQEEPMLQGKEVNVKVTEKSEPKIVSPPPPPLIPPPPVTGQSLAPPTPNVTSPGPAMPSPGGSMHLTSTPNMPGFVCINVPIFITSGDGSNTTVTALPHGAQPPPGTPVAIPQQPGAVLPQTNMPPNIPAGLPPGAVLMQPHLVPPLTPVSSTPQMIPMLQPPPGQVAPAVSVPQKLTTPPPALPIAAPPAATPAQSQEELEPGEIRSKSKPSPPPPAPPALMVPVASTAVQNMVTTWAPSLTTAVPIPAPPPPNMSAFQLQPAKANVQPAPVQIMQQPKQVPTKGGKSSGKTSLDPLDQYVIDLSVKRAFGKAKAALEAQGKVRVDSPLFDDDKQAMQDQYNLMLERKATPTNSASSSKCSTPTLSSMKNGGKKKLGGLSMMVEKLWQNKKDKPEEDVKVDPAPERRVKQHRKPQTPDVAAMEQAMASMAKPMKIQPQTATIPISPFLKRPRFSSDVTMEKNDSVELEMVKSEKPMFHSPPLDSSMMNEKQDLHVTENPSQVIEVPQVPNIPYLPDYSYMDFESKTKPDSSFCTLKFHTCPVCKQLFSTSDAMRAHMKKEHATKRLTNRTRAMKPKPPSKERLNCPCCSFSTTSLFTLKHHRITTHPDYVGSTAVDTANVKPPVLSPPKETRIKCRFPGCGRSFKELRHLRVHQTLHTSEKPLSCNLCSYSCRLRSSLHWHMKNRHNVDRVKGQGNNMVYVNQEGMILGNAHDDDEDNIEDGIQEDPEAFMENLKNETPACVTMESISPPQHIQGTVMEIEEQYDAPLDMSTKVKNEMENVVVVQPTSPSPKPKPELPVKNVSPPQGQGELSLYKIEASPGPDPQFFTSVMKFNIKGSSNSKSAAAAAAAAEARRCVCGVCKEAFDDAELMWKHKLDVHRDVTQFHCDCCSFVTSSQCEVQSHVMSTHGKEMGEFKEFICFICSKGYSSKNGLNHHLMRHSDEGPLGFSCPVQGCTARLLSKNALKNHNKRCHSKQSSPELPPLPLPMIEQADSPQSQNGEERILVCGYHGCDRTFRESKHLKVHRMQHTDEKPLKCELCFYSCRQRNSMNWHMKSKHAMEKHVTPDGRTIYLAHDDMPRV